MLYSTAKSKRLNLNARTEGGFLMTVKVYSTPMCPWCDKVKKYLGELGVEFEEVDVSADRAAAMEMVRKTHQMGVPVVEIGDRFIVGYNPEAIEEALRAESLL